MLNKHFTITNDNQGEELEILIDTEKKIAFTICSDKKIEVNFEEKKDVGLEKITYEYKHIVISLDDFLKVAEDIKKLTL